MASTGRTPLNQHWALINPNHPACGQIEFIAPAPRGTFGSIRCNTVLRISTHNQSTPEFTAIRTSSSQQATTSSQH